MQFDDVPEEEQERVFEALMRYCNLDTFAMVMIYQHRECIRNIKN